MRLAVIVPGHHMYNVGTMLTAGWASSCECLPCLSFQVTLRECTIERCGLSAIRCQQEDDIYCEWSSFALFFSVQAIQGRNCRTAYEPYSLQALSCFMKTAHGVSSRGCK